MAREGSGSLLLKAEKVLGRDKVRKWFLRTRSQYHNLQPGRINMFLHDIGFDKFNIACEDTLIAPVHWDDEPLNLSFQILHTQSSGLVMTIHYLSMILVLRLQVFSHTKDKADRHLLCTVFSWLASNGTAAIVCFPGIMYHGKC